MKSLLRGNFVSCMSIILEKASLSYLFVTWKKFWIDKEKLDNVKTSIKPSKKA